MIGSGIAPEQLPDCAGSVFGVRLPLAQRYADLLVTDGVTRGLLGPREPSRIWTRHLLNCAVIADLFTLHSRVVDVGSGAGLPGLALAIARPDLRVDLVEPLQRRANFLDEVITALELSDQVRVVRGRAEEPAVVAAVGNAPAVTARAVAPLGRLVRWCLPLLAPDGSLVLMKGASAADELTQHRTAVERLGAVDLELLACGGGVVDPPVAVVRMRRGRTPSVRKGKR